MDECIKNEIDPAYPGLLDRGMPDFRGYNYVAYTLSFPLGYIGGWPSYIQKRKYAEFMKKWLRNTRHVKCKKEYNIFAEFDKSGKVHTHGFIKETRREGLSQLVVLMDFAKTHAMTLKNYGVTYYERNVMSNDHGITYKAPGICLDIIKSQEDFDRWMIYCTDDQPDKYRDRLSKDYVLKIEK